MSIAVITEQYLKDIADAIRFKNDTTDEIATSDMGQAILKIKNVPNPKLRINITQSDNQTISCTRMTVDKLTLADSTLELTPDMFTLHFGITPQKNYKAGTLSITDYTLETWNDIINVSATPATAVSNYIVFNKSTNTADCLFDINDGSTIYTINGTIDMLGNDFHIDITYTDTITSSVISTTGGPLYNFFKKHKVKLYREKDGYGLYWNSMFSARSVVSTQIIADWVRSESYSLGVTKDNTLTIWNNLKTSFLTNGENLVVQFV